MPTTWHIFTSMPRIETAVAKMQLRVAAMLDAARGGIGRPAIAARAPSAHELGAFATGVDHRRDAHDVRVER